MAYYSDGNRLLTSDEYYAEVIFKWKFCLFVIGSLVVGFTAYASLPPEWDTRSCFLFDGAEWRKVKWKI